MIHSVRFTCVLDTNVIYPVNIRDLLLWFAYYDLFTVKWSNGICDEWVKVMRSKGIAEPAITKRVQRMFDAFPDALVENYEGLIEGLSLPDKDDRHVLAAAIKANANLIVTNNLKDFPASELTKFGLEAKSADDFLTDIIDLNQTRALEAFKELVSNRRSPELDAYEVLDQFRQVGLKNTADYLHALL
ncbi:MAG: PIN domain-containing protein [Flavobacteriales bacterium]